MDFNIVVAVDSEHGIGKNNTLPWRLSGDLKFFKQLTCHASAGKQNAVIMGRKTWDSLPAKVKPLPERLNIVLSRQSNLALPEGVLQANSLESALSLCHESEISEIFVIGGSELFKTALEDPGLKRVYLTEIYKSFDCDVFFPDYRGKLALQSGSDRITENEIDYSFKILEPLGKV
ncbi:MAG: dihydrofolate reductase [Candidatus Obscuribacterales bacterium]|nr:dihydrofolate reductase [Candidatus Obscuribacterales bacterium]